jgi:hypothetical protein
MAPQRNSLATGALAGAKYTLSPNGGSPKLALPRHNGGILEERKECKKCWNCRAQVVYETSNCWWLSMSRGLMAGYQAETGVCGSVCCCWFARASVTATNKQFVAMNRDRQATPYQANTAQHRNSSRQIYKRSENARMCSNHFSLYSRSL